MSHIQKNDDNNLSPDSNKDSIPSNESDKTRRILVYISGGLALLSFIGFLVTGNINILIGTSSVLAYPLFRVMDYYFRR